ncbi:hypothetical protein [Hyphomonas sp. TMED31]
MRKLEIVDLVRPMMCAWNDVIERRSPLLPQRRMIQFCPAARHGLAAQGA